MEVTEKSVKLSHADVDWLRQQQGHYGGVYLLAAIAGSALVFAPLQRNTAEVYLLVVIGLLGAVLVLPLFLRMRAERRKVEQDLWSEHKKVIAAPVESQRMAAAGETKRQGRNYGSVAMSYYITVGGREYRVSERDYFQIRTGQIVEAHRAQPSGRLIRLLLLEAGESKEIGSNLNLRR